ncbi:MAG: PQQ-like beta-propeller repeat protein [Gemmataceae bacterium]|nr:PQQ-like beta-propeller repeat protein [Gemmataceae bacterium]
MLVLLAAPLTAADWPQWRGPGGSGVASEKNLPVKWGAAEGLRWKVELPGRGLSAPVIVGGRVFVTACTGPDQERLHVLCLDEATGKKLWERQFWATGTTLCHQKTNMAAPTPATDGKHVYALFASHDLVCLDRDGNLRWFRSLTGDYPTVGNNVGMASSPVLWKGLVLLAVENAGESFAVGIDRQTGQNRWRVPRPRGINWVTPLVIEHKTKQGTRAEVLFQSGSDLSAYDPATGAQRWTYTGKGMATIPSPVFAEGRLLVPGGRFQALKPSADGQPPELLWQSTKLPTGYCSPVGSEGRVYAVSSRGIVNCADATTGKPLWDVRLEGEFAASPLVADGKVYVVSEEGTATVLRAGPKLEVLGTSAVGEKILASPAAANGALYLRSDRHLYCIGEKKMP